MGRIGYSYGSEWHQLRFLGYHRDDLNRHVESAIPGGKVVRWLDQNYRRNDQPPDPGCYSWNSQISGRRPGPRNLDREWRAIDFLDPDELARVQNDWINYWPQTGNKPNFDAVAQVDVGGRVHWLMIEAKSHLKEVISFCSATEPACGMILNAFTATAQNMHAEVDVNLWLGPYYQFCNRLAVLNFLDTHEIPAKLLFIYFLGDLFPEGGHEVCPANQQGWEPLRQAMEAHVGWTNAEQNILYPHVHKLFLPVTPPPV